LTNLPVISLSYLVNNQTSGITFSPQKMEFPERVHSLK